MNTEKEFYICLWDSKSGWYAHIASAANHKILEEGISYFESGAREWLRNASRQFAIEMLGEVPRVVADDLFIVTRPIKIQEAS